MTGNNLGETYLRSGQYEEAERYLEESNEITEQIGDRLGQGITGNNLGLVALNRGRYDEAKEWLSGSLEINKQVGNLLMSGQLLSQAGLARLELEQNNTAEAMTYVMPILNYLETNPTLTGSDGPFLIFLICYNVLTAAQDPRAPQLLDTAYRLLVERASKIKDEAARRSFLENVSEHRAIVTLEEND